MRERPRGIDLHDLSKNWKKERYTTLGMEERKDENTENEKNMRKEKYMYQRANDYTEANFRVKYIAD